MTRSSGKDGPTFPGSVAKLRKFLAGPAHPQGTLRYHELQGFLFTIAAVPELVPPSAWIPEVFGGSEPAFDAAGQAKEILGGLMLLYNEVNTDVFEHGGRLPADCRFLDEALANLEDDAPVGQWSRGFLHGHAWLRKIWDEETPKEASDELAALVLVLSFFSSKRFAERWLEESANDATLFEMAETMRRVLPDALAGYARLGRSIHQIRLKHHRTGRTEKAGRNEPCPCGSGKKHKRCCRVSP